MPPNQEPVLAPAENLHPTLAVGRHVYIAGTGQWWSGHHFGAVVVDIRESDNTIKVQYTDGGFKRFKVDVFRTLVTEKQAAPQMWEEWSVTSREENSCELRDLHDKIMSAVRKGDMVEADDLRAKYKEIAIVRDSLKSLRIQLRDAVDRGEYLKAHDLQQQIIKFEGESHESSGLLPSQGTTASSSTTMSQVLTHSAEKALGGGLAGASAMVLQVSSLMWLRTAMNYQYRYGTGTRETIRTLYAEGGVSRFYRGIGPALLQGPLARFADTAANAGVLAVFDETEARSLPMAARTVFASITASAMRIALMPVDNLKTVLQVEGKNGLTLLAAKYRSRGAPVFYHGAVATSAATFVSHYPWFTVFNVLNEAIPNYHDRPRKLARDAGIGVCASVCADTAANSLRVLKTYRQARDTLPYLAIVKEIVKADGVTGLFGRGLQTRIIGNAASGLLFSVLYRLFEERFASPGSKR